MTETLECAECGRRWLVTRMKSAAKSYYTVNCSCGEQMPSDIAGGSIVTYAGGGEEQ